MKEKVAKTPQTRVKPRSRHKSVRFSKLRALTCFQEVHDRISEGWPLKQVAKYIQNDKHEYTDVTLPSLISVLHEYRASFAPGEKIKGTVLSPLYDEAVEEVKEGLDELAELEKLYELQMQRVKIDHVLEEQLKKLLPSTVGEIRAAKEILVARANLKIELGINPRNLGTVDVQLTAPEETKPSYDSSTEKALKSDQSRRKLLSLAERVMSVSKGPQADALKDLDMSILDRTPEDEASEAAKESEAGAA